MSETRIPPLMSVLVVVVVVVVQARVRVGSMWRIDEARASHGIFR